MLKIFKTVIQKWQSNNAKWLVAVSGGGDSVALCHLLKAVGVPFAIAHCNFQLRGEESDGDEAFVRTLAQQLDVECYVQHFKTAESAANSGKSIQVTARNLRYMWLQSLCLRYDFQYLATAHHLNDSIETILINMLRGCGLRGLVGIPEQNRNIIRPLLNFTKEDILEYLEENHYPFREDSSNEKDDYTRNYLRHHVVPELKQINPQLEHTFLQNIKYWKDTLTVYEAAVEMYEAQVVSGDRADFEIYLESLPPHLADTLLHEWLHPYGFTADNIRKMREVKQRGKVFETPEFKATVENNIIYVRKKEGERQEDSMIINNFNGSYALQGGKLLLKTASVAEAQQHFGDRSTAVFDMAHVSLPFTWRFWRAGDRFQPYGMGGKTKLVSDLLIQNKLNLFEKEKVRVLETAEGVIAWVVGIRTDNRVLVSSQTQKVVICQWIERK